MGKTRAVILGACIVGAIAACGSKKQDEDKPPGPSQPVAKAKTGAETPKQIFAVLKEAVGANDFKRALTMIRPQEHTIFVGLAYMDAAMPVVLKLNPTKEQISGYEGINRKHNLVVDERELIKVAQGRKFSDLVAYFNKTFKGNDLVALWADVSAVVPKKRQLWLHLEVGRVKLDGNKGKVTLHLKGQDTSARFDVVRDRGKWYLDISAFGSTMRPPRPAQNN